MKTRDRESFIDPLFYEALSGEFFPDCDPQKRAHTLGRLTVGAVSKGRPDTPMQIDIGRKFYEYEPTWSEGITAVVGCVVISRNVELIQSLTLESQQDSIGYHHITPSTLIDDSPAAQKIMIINPMKSGLPARELDIQLGPDLASVQQEVARTSQQFFNNLT